VRGNWVSQQESLQVASARSDQGERRAKPFGGKSYMILSKAMESHEVARGRGTAKSVLSRIQRPVLIIGIDSDILYPIKEQIELAELIPHSTFREIKSKYGHDAFLIEFDQINNAIKSFQNVASSQLSV